MTCCAWYGKAVHLDEAQRARFVKGARIEFEGMRFTVIVTEVDKFGDLVTRLTPDEPDGGVWWLRHAPCGAVHEWYERKNPYGGHGSGVRVLKLVQDGVAQGVLL